MAEAEDREVLCLFFCRSFVGFCGFVYKKNEKCLLKILLKVFGEIFLAHCIGKENTL